MKCPNCGKELITEEDGTLTCEECGARFRKKKKTSTAEPSSLPEEQQASAPAPQVAPPKEEPMLTEEPAEPLSEEITFAQDSKKDPLPFFEGHFVETKAMPSDEDAEDDLPFYEEPYEESEDLPFELLEVDSLEENTADQHRFAGMQAKQNAPQENPLTEWFEKIKAWIADHKKITAGIVLGVLVLISILIPILVTFCGVRGIYVCKDYPVLSLQFKASSFTYQISTKESIETVAGEYKISGNKITLSIKDASYGNETATLDFEKLNGNKLIKIGEESYERVGYSLNKKVTLTFIDNEGKTTVKQKVLRGEFFQDNLATPKRIGYLFTGWKTKTGEAFEPNLPFWKNATYYASWAECTHEGADCSNTSCSYCGKALSDMDPTEKASLHLFNEIGACSLCGTSGVTVKANVVIDIGHFTGSNLVIPQGVTHIGEDAFHGCSGLTSVTIPDSVTVVESLAFYECTNLTEIRYEGDLKSWCEISGLPSLLIFGTPDKDLYINDQKIEGDLIIPSNVTSIGFAAFCNCLTLTSVTIPKSVTKIEDAAFYGCSALTSISIPNSVTSIGQAVFSGCSSLTSISIPFVGAEKNPSEDACQYPFGYIFGPEDYSGATKVSQYNISNSIPLLENYYIPTSLRKVTVTGGNIPSYAFADCSMLTAVTISNGVTSIGEGAFEGCYRLVEIYNLSSLCITKGSTDNGSVAYYAKAIYTTPYTSKLSIDDDGYLLYTDGSEKTLIAYTGMETELTLPADITEINQYAFYERSDLLSVTIGKDVKRIFDSAFYGCKALTSIYYQGTKTEWQSIEIRGYSNRFTVHCTDGDLYY